MLKYTCLQLLSVHNLNQPVLQIRSISMPFHCQLPSQGMFKDYVDDGLGNYTGECVSLVKRMCPSLPLTSQWRKGNPVKGNKSIVPGTAIASFDPKTGKYWHAAIYVSQDTGGIWVWDQFNTGSFAHPPKLNQLRWGNTHRPRVDADHFFVIE
jgi:hypothetical protein